MHKSISSLYNYFLSVRHVIIRPLLLVFLFLALIIGAGFRAIEIKNNSGINSGFEPYISAASYFWSHPGGFNYNSSVYMIEHPDDYFFTRHPKEPVSQAFESEKGWAFILSLIFTEGQKGVTSLADTVIRYNMIVDLGVLVCLFFAGKSIAGPMGGCISAILYALFRPAMNHMSWVSYYYWAYPFSALSLVFWTVIYRPERKSYSLKLTALLFFLYGALIGFAVFGRMLFLYLTLALTPIIFFRERVFKRALVLSIAMLVGQATFIVPQILITHKNFNKYTLSTRGGWYFAFMGLGAYTNPWGIRDSGEVSANKWSMEKGGPDINVVGVEAWDGFFKKQVFAFLKERPDVFWRNAKINLDAGITSQNIGGVRYAGGSDPPFFGMSPKYYPLYLQFLKNFLWVIALLLLSYFLLCFNRLGPLLSAVFQGLYFVGMISLFFPCIDTHIAGYFPVYVLLIGTSFAVLGRFFLAFPEGFIRCWVTHQQLRLLPRVIGECFKEDWDEKHDFTPAEPSDMGKRTNIFKGRLIAGFLFILLFFVDWYMVKTWNDALDQKPDTHKIQLINNIVNAETSGGFESWSEKEPLTPEGWLFSTSGKTGKIRQTHEKDNVHVGKSSAEILTGDSVSSSLVFILTPDKVYHLLAKSVTLEAWVRSDNKTKNAIFLSFQGGTDIYPQSDPITYYQNSGGWEKLSLTFATTKKNIVSIPVVFVINSPGTVTYLDGVGIRYDPKQVK